MDPVLDIFAVGQTPLQKQAGSGAQSFIKYRLARWIAGLDLFNYSFPVYSLRWHLASAARPGQHLGKIPGLAMG
jgi:hypothetical protein